MSGRVTLLGAGSRDVQNAIVYLEPIAVPRPVEAAPRPQPAPQVAAPPPAPVPRDTVSVLWEMMRELRQTVAELRDAVRQLRAQLQGGPLAAPLPTTPSATRTDSAAAAASPTPAGAEPIGVPTGAPAGTPGSSPPTPPPAARERVIPGTSMAMRQKTFEPHVRVVEVGGLVEYPNEDPFSHNVFSTTPGGAFDLGLYPRGESRGVAFRKPGTYAIYCNIHSKMSAFVVAVPSALHAQPQADGRFTIPGVLPGRYRLHAWHERAPEQVTVITVSERGAGDIPVTLDARSYRPAPHLNKFGQPYPTATRDAY